MVHFCQRHSGGKLLRTECPECNYGNKTVTLGKRKSTEELQIHTCTKRGEGTTTARYCRACRHRQYLVWRQRNPEKYDALKKKENAALAYRRYGLSKDEYDSKLAAQKNLCAVCGKAQENNRGKDSLCVDHDHVTGKVRDLLCVKCNSGIGMFDDSVELLTAALAYLVRHKDEVK
jgi:hypothetical protein